MRRVLYLFVLLGVVVSCMERPQPKVYHPKLVQIDSLLQHDSLKWKNLNRGEVMEDVYGYTGEPFKSDTSPRTGTYYYDGITNMFYPVRELLIPWDDGFKERGVLTKACQPMFLLKHLPKDSLISEADRMYYSLLKAETLVKDYITRKHVFSIVNRYLGSDSILREVASYYDDLNDKPMQARAHALLAFYQRGSNTVDEVREFLIAARYAQEVGNEELLAFIYRFLGHTYFWGNAYQKADSIYALAEPLAIAQKDTMLWMESIMNRLKIEMNIGTRSAFRADEGHFHALQRMYQGMDLAQKYKAYEYEADFACLLGEEYLDKEHSDEVYLGKALHYAKKAESLYKRHGNAYKLLAKVYARMGKTDSTAFYLSYIYGDGWQETGPVDLWVKTIRPKEEGNIAAVETELQKEWQKEQYEGFLLRNKYVLAGVALAGVLLAFGLHGYHRRRYRMQSERLNQQLYTSRLLHTFLQKGLKEREAEILRLQEELNRYCLDESTKRRDLTEELNIANENRHILAQEAMKQSPAYNKIQLIMNDFRWKEESDHRLDENDWQELMDSVDACYNKVLARLSGQYCLDERELHICCLSLIDVPVVHIAHLIGYTRPVVYKAEQKILQKMGRSYEKGYLRKLLKTI